MVECAGEDNRNAWPSCGHATSETSSSFVTDHFFGRVESDTCLQGREMIMTSLHQRYRPQSFDGVIGHEATIERLKAVLSNEKGRPHSYLLHGPTGCGKTTIGRIIAKELGCKGTDFVELDSAEFRGIDTVRSIRKHMPYLPMESKCRVWLLDEAHALTNDAQTALLKALGEPPSHVYFILCTTLPEKLLPTLRSRCSQYVVSQLTDIQIKYLLRRVIKGEGGSMLHAVYKQIIRSSNGLPRQALIVLEQVLAVPESSRMEAARYVADGLKLL